MLGCDPRTQAGALRRRIGAQLRESALPDRIKVWEALDLFASLSPAPTDWETLLEEWGLADKRSATFGSLSGGQQQRLFVALALVNNPELVFLDEMTTGLDPSARRVAWDLIRKIRERGTTVVLVTHFMDEAEALCDRLIVIDDKHVVATGTPQELIRTHGGGITVRFTAERQGDDFSWLADVSDVTAVTQDRARVEVRGRGAVLAQVGAALVARGSAPADRGSSAPPSRTSTSASRTERRCRREDDDQALLRRAQAPPRDPLTVLFSLALPIVNLFVLGGVFGNQPTPRAWGGVGAMSFTSQRTWRSSSPRWA